MRCFVVAGFLLTSASRSPSAIAELLVVVVREVNMLRKIERGKRGEVIRVEMNVQVAAEL